MPLVDIEITLKEYETLSKDMAASLANELGKIFNSPSNSTWVKVRGLPVYQYAENGETQKDVFPVFDKIIKSKLLISELQNEAELIAIAVAQICERSTENIHIIYEPEGSGQVAFGGKLIG
jgi:phenylpyruvate tautomerase PptA (4-oxalocrotonate tautomerase family)